MADPVVHFEIIGTEPGKLRGYYGKLFGWEFDTSTPVSDTISDPDDYGFIQPISKGGVAGGIGGGNKYTPQAIFYVGVPDVGAALDKAESLGGKRRLGPVKSPSGKLVVGQFTDPDGNVVGVAGEK